MVPNVRTSLKQARLFLYFGIGKPTPNHLSTHPCILACNELDLYSLSTRGGVRRVSAAIFGRTFRRHFRQIFSGTTALPCHHPAGTPFQIQLLHSNSDTSTKAKSNQSQTSHSLNKCNQSSSRDNPPFLLMILRPSRLAPHVSLTAVIPTLADRQVLRLCRGSRLRSTFAELCFPELPAGPIQTLTGASPASPSCTSPKLDADAVGASPGDRYPSRVGWPDWAVPQHHPERAARRFLCAWQSNAWR
jgi:hypothetical protein